MPPISCPRVTRSELQAVHSARRSRLKMGARSMHDRRRRADTDPSVSRLPRSAQGQLPLFDGATSATEFLLRGYFAIFELASSILVEMSSGERPAD
jgi:hypothetical protein